MKLGLNQKGIVLSGLIYALLIFYLLLLVSMLTILWYRQSALNVLKRQADNVYKDLIPPTIKLIGDTNVDVDINYVYNELGATAMDDVDGDITANIEITGTVNMNVIGSYAVTYTVSDAAGNESIATRTVNVTSSYVADKGVNRPRLAVGMTPIKWDGEAWVDTTAKDSDWYNYTLTDHKWANARTADGSMWVWIPRYIYKISNGWHTNTAGTIDIQFSKGTNDNWNNTVIGDIDTNSTVSASNNKWTNHPSFTFGGIELTGIWVAKFEASNDGSNNIKAIPNVTSWRTITISSIYNNTRAMETNSVYGWGTSGSNIDTHMIKNVEWGAAAYLSKSTYGKNTELWINNSSTYVTGCAGPSALPSTYAGCQYAYNTENGTQTSTTGNIYGIYDMAGGTSEYVAAYVNNGNNALNTYGADLINGNIRYRDVYTVTTDSTLSNYNDASSKKGDAVYETSNSYTSLNSWYEDASFMPYSYDPWFVRGGNYDDGNRIGVFNFYRNEGSDNSYLSFRPVIAVYNDSQPGITLNGDSVVQINVGSTYSDLGATAYDELDGNISSSIMTTGTVNPSVVGTYYINYNVTDSNGNAATQVVRTVYVKDGNAPVLATGMTPVKWNGTSWIKTAANDPEWYNYNTTSRKWANVLTADGSMWVWIPRYIYKISTGWHTSTAGTIDVQFSRGVDDTRGGTVTLDTGTTSDASNNKWTSHPAFTFGSTQLTGMWVAKFEATASEGVASTGGSCNAADNVTSKTTKIVPNAISWRCISMGNIYTVARNMETNSIYGWGTSGTGIDTHVMKNTEWGVVAYLSKSAYGSGSNEVWINPANNYTTGCAGDSATSVPTTGCLRAYDTENGVKASTTSNVYGIYDINGSGWEGVMGNLGNVSGSSQIANVSAIPDQYINRYAAGTYAYAVGYKGDALYETSYDVAIWNGSSWSGNSTGSWYTDSARALGSTIEWYGRGGDFNAGNSGAFAFGPYEGGPNPWLAFRPVLLVNSGL